MLIFSYFYSSRIPFLRPTFRLSCRIPLSALATCPFVEDPLSPPFLPVLSYRIPSLLPTYTFFRAGSTSLRPTYTFFRTGSTTLRPTNTSYRPRSLRSPSYLSFHSSRIPPLHSNYPSFRPGSPLPVLPPRPFVQDPPFRPTYPSILLGSPPQSVLPTRTFF